jgi:predicted dehydrogenase
MSGTKERLGVGIIGCGLIGHKRAKALPAADQLVACADVSLDRAQALARSFGATAVTDWRIVTDDPAIDLVIVATPHDALAEITLAAVNAGKHVLVEKPAARFASELIPVLAARDKKRVQVHVGFNHRYHRSLRKAKELVSSGVLGELMFIRGRYGHGGRIGYDREWRANPAVSGGGELIDQGPHLIDLSRWFLGEFTYVRQNSFSACLLYRMEEPVFFGDLRTKRETRPEWTRRKLRRRACHLVQDASRNGAAGNLLLGIPNG